MYITQDEWDEANSRRLIKVKPKKSAAEIRDDVDEKSEVQGIAKQSAEERNGREDQKKVEQTDMLETPAQANPLAGYIIVLDPGHQMFENTELEQLTPNAPGSLVPKCNAGALGVWSGYPEYVYVLQFCERLKAQLESIGAQVYMTRIENDVDISGRERALFANELGADMVISVHADYHDDTGTQGFALYVPSFEHVDNVDLLVESKLIGTYINMELVTSTGNVSRGVLERKDISEFNWSAVPIVGVELGCLSNEGDDVSLQADSYRQALLEGVANGVLKYYLDRAVYRGGEGVNNNAGEQANFNDDSEDNFFNNSFERSNETGERNW